MKTTKEAQEECIDSSPVWLGMFCGSVTGSGPGGTGEVVPTARGGGGSTAELCPRGRAWHICARHEGKETSLPRAFRCLHPHGPQAASDRHTTTPGQSPKPGQSPTPGYLVSPQHPVSPQHLAT